MNQSSLQTPSVAPDASWKAYTQRLLALYNTGQFTLQSLWILSITIQIHYTKICGHLWT